MRLRDLIWPWGALAELRGVVAAQRHGIALRDDELQKLYEDAKQAHRDLNEARLRLCNAQIEMNRLSSIVARGYFRNPANGNLGRKGQVFPPKAPKVPRGN